MHKLRLQMWAGVVAGLGLTGCQTARISPAFPAVREYETVQATSPTTLVAALPPGPTGTYTLLLSEGQPKVEAAKLATRLSNQPTVSARSAFPVSTPALKLTLADSLRIPQTVKDISPKPDLQTTIVNSLGAATAAIGLGMVVTQATTNNPQTETGALSQIVGVLFGLLVIVGGLALVFFQGKNGRVRRLREARKAA